MPFGSLWLAVVASAAAVWLVSAVLHMVLKYHRADFRPLADEEAVSQAVRRAGPAPGVYALPYIGDLSKMKDPAVRKRYEDGPVAILTVMRNGVPAIGKHLVQWLVFCFLVSFLTAYVARHTLTFGAPGLEVMRVTGLVALGCYGFGYLQDSIWKAVPWPISLRGAFDAVVYALTTALVFRFLWPAA